MTAVYLAGHITGLTYANAIQWRDEATERLLLMGFEVRDPMRGKESLEDRFQDKALPSEGYGDGVPSHIENPYARDKYDITHSDIVLANLAVGEQCGLTPSVGTLVELGIAEGLGKLILIISTNTHPFIKGPADCMFDTLDDALTFIETLTPTKMGGIIQVTGESWLKGVFAKDYAVPTDADFPETGP